MNSRMDEIEKALGPWCRKCHDRHFANEPHLRIRICCEQFGQARHFFAIVRERVPTADVRDHDVVMCAESGINPYLRPKHCPFCRAGIVVEQFE